MATVATARTPAQVFATAFGVVYLLIGVVGFFVTGFDNFADATTEELIVFGINPLHNIVHIAVGLLLLAGARTHTGAKQMNLLIGVVYGLVTVVGLANVLVDDILSANNADDFLHLVTAVLALYFGTAGAEGARPATT